MDAGNSILNKTVPVFKELLALLFLRKEEERIEKSYAWAMLAVVGYTFFDPISFA